jgi:hypothetical protein
MRPLIAVLTAVLTMSVASPLASGQERALALDVTNEVASASEVGKRVQDALQAAAETDLWRLKLSKAVLAVETGMVQEKNFEVKFIIFTISHKTKKGMTQTSTLTFTVPVQEGTAYAKGGPKPLADLKEPLARAIATAATMAASINVLPLSEATIKIEFAVSREAGGKIGFTIVSVEGGAGIDFTKTSKNSLELTFTGPAKR